MFVGEQADPSDLPRSARLGLLQRLQPFGDRLLSGVRALLERFGFGSCLACTIISRFNLPVDGLDRALKGGTSISERVLWSRLAPAWATFAVSFATSEGVVAAAYRIDWLTVLGCQFLERVRLTDAFADQLLGLVVDLLGLTHCH